MTEVLFLGREGLRAEWGAALEAAAAEAGLALDIATDPGAVDADAVGFVVAAPGKVRPDFDRYPNLRLIQSVWAGVERFLDNPTLPRTAPLCRMAEPGLTEGMVEYVVGHTLRLHLGMDEQIARSRDGVWRGDAPPLARDRGVTVLGLGELGAAAGRALAGLNFDVTGWRRGAKAIPGLRCLHGADGFAEALSRAEILILLLPATPETDGLIDAEALSRLPPGAGVINPGRGALIDDAALLAALDSGQVARAVLDVFREEPLPAAHPYFGHPQVTVTPHVASETRIAGAARVAVAQIGRVLKGEAPTHVVDRERGY